MTRTNPLLHMSAIFVAAASVSGCAMLGNPVGPDYRPPSFEAPSEWLSQAPLAGVAPTGWDAFGDPLLVDLVARASANNRSLAAAAADVARARALRRAAIGELWPSANASAAQSDIHNSENGLIPFGALPGGATQANVLDLELTAIWNLDLSGAIWRSVEAASARTEALDAAQMALALSIASETAETYIMLRGREGQLALAERSVEIRARTLELAQERFDVGDASRFDVERALAARQRAEARVPSLRAQIARLRLALGLLTGENPQAAARRLLGTPDNLAARDLPLNDAPLSVLARRPDVRQAERTLAATTASIGVAEGRLYPSLTLFGALGAEARNLDDLFNAESRTSLLGPSLRLPIFGRGRLRALVRSEEAAAQAALARFDHVVMSALADADAALATAGEAGRTLAALDNAVEANMRAQELARLRYESGEDSLLPLLESDRELIDVETERLDARTNLLLANVRLVRALGGPREAVVAHTEAGSANELRGRSTPDAKR
ncbi:MAG: efflux transporter outer membrane subunit [Hyphomonadaceae bacterium]|nr:MAG: RND-family efflux transporter [Caulobacteraceae bacterium]MBT9445821.1 efflux transporter outer membrane subunit [Hyphomonadaceae bacterium]